MATINISSIISYYNTGTNSVSSSASGSGFTPSDAKDAALGAAQNAVNSVGAGTPANGGGSSSTTTLKFGSNYGSVTGGPGVPSEAIEIGNKYYSACTYNASRTSTMYQVKLSFTIPTDLTASNITSASISFTAKAGDANVQTYYLCAPKTTSGQTSYQKYSETTIIDTSKYASFSSPGNTTTETYTLNITDVFKQCVTKGQGWVTILLPIDTPGGTYSMTISGTPQITYSESYSKCTAPTTVNFTSIVKPGGTLTISWSGASGGTNNNISGYDIYYRIGAKPTTSTYDGAASVTTTSKEFTISSNATRGGVFYAMIRTKGTAGSSYYSSWKEASGGVVNSLPGAPTVSVDKPRIKSTGSTTIKFTVTAGSDNNTSQTKTLYYATSSTGAKTAFTSPLNVTLSAAATYYFWTYDGLEYSSSYTSKAITKNIAPTISNVTMSAYNNITYTPTFTLNGSEKDYVKNINGVVSASSTSGNIVSYSWKLQTWVRTSTSVAPEWVGGTSIGTTTTNTITNKDVTSYGAGFGMAYRLAVTVIDDIGESSSEAYSSTVYGIPPAPTVTVVNRKGDTSYDSSHNANPYHFNNGLRFKYSNNNTGLTRELQYSTSSNFNSYTTVSLTGTNYSDFTPTSLTRGTTYYFRIKFTCNSKTTTSSVSSGYMRAKDITPNITSITAPSGTVIKPYTQSTLSFTFTNSPISWDYTQDVAESYSDIYSIKFKFGANELSVTSIGNNSDGTVNGTVTLSSITTTKWKSLLGITNAPNNTYSINLEVTARNGFGSTFSSSKTFTVNFIEGINSINSPVLEIKTGNSTYTPIPDSYINAELANRYPIFETQVLRLRLDQNHDIKCYANQVATIYFKLGSTILGQTDVTASDWEEVNTSGTSYRYKLNATKTIEYEVPSCSTTTIRDFSVTVVLGNGESSTSTGGNLKTTAHYQVELSRINFKITNATEQSQGWNCTNWGGYDESNSYSSSYSKITAQVTWSSSPNGTYATLGSAVNIKSNETSTPATSGVFSNNLPTTTDIIYLGTKVVLTLKFVKINNATPVGTSSYTQSYKNQFTYYRATPNLLYGKNFFALNQNQPLNNREDQILEISATQYTNNGSQVIRKSIYFGEDNTSKFVITSNGLEIDCGSW